MGKTVGEQPERNRVSCVIQTLSIDFVPEVIGSCIEELFVQVCGFLQGEKLSLCGS